MDVPTNVKRAWIEAAVIRADGTVENLGIVSFYHRNPIISLAVNKYIYLRNRLRRLRGN